MGRLDQKVAVITGAAGGIGEASARLFAREGAHVIIADLEDTRGKALAAEIGAMFIHVDVTQEADIKAAVDLAVSQFGRLDCMFNNAGFGGANGMLEELTVEGFDHTVAVLLRGPFFGMKYAAPVMKRQGYGSIISTASVAGIVTGSAGHLYSMCKAGLIHLTHSAAMELGGENIRVNCICPGAIMTGIFGAMMGMDADAAAQSAQNLKVLFSQSQPIPRGGLPEDVANAALFLASDESTYVSGHALVVDGALTVGSTWQHFQQTTQALAHAMGK